jgi:mannose-6-phosphate isomerase-like protein (cupin superfamily)
LPEQKIAHLKWRTYFFIVPKYELIWISVCYFLFSSWIQKLKTMQDKVNITEKFGQIHEYWSPKIIGVLNGQEVKLAKIKGEFPWHHHEHEDELFWVVKGAFTLRLKDREIHLQEGEFFIVPKGTEHQPVAEEEAHILLFEPANTLNTGNVVNEFTKTAGTL